MPGGRPNRGVEWVEIRDRGKPTYAAFVSKPFFVEGAGNLEWDFGEVFNFKTNVDFAKTRVLYSYDYFGGDLSGATWYEVKRKEGGVQV